MGIWLCHIINNEVLTSKKLKALEIYTLLSGSTFTYDILPHITLLDNGKPDMKTQWVLIEPTIYSYAHHMHQAYIEPNTNISYVEVLHIQLS